MKNKIKILIFGIGQSNFLNQLYGGIKELDYEDKFHFSINTYKEFTDKDVKYENLPYVKIFNFPLKTLNSVEFKKTFFTLMFTKLFWIYLYFGLKADLSWHEIKLKLGHLAKIKYLVDNTIMPLKFDAIHLHYCIPEYLIPVYFINRRIKTICSFWGSDLLRTDGIENITIQREVLKKADIVTIQTPELSKLLWNKLGENLKDKTRILKFTLSKEIFHNIDLYRYDHKAKLNFKKELGLPSNKIIISLGHNGFPENNHLSMINELINLSSAIKEEFVFLVHSSYGANTNYLKEMERIEGLDLTIITDFFGPEKIAKLRLITDLLIQMPTTDALSAAMTEILYAQNSVVSASWLPYQEFKRKGIFHFELNAFKELSQFLINYRNNMEKIKLNNEKNSELIKNYFFPDKTTPAWVKLYKSLVS